MPGPLAVCRSAEQGMAAAWVAAPGVRGKASADFADAAGSLTGSCAGTPGNYSFTIPRNPRARMRTSGLLKLLIGRALRGRGHTTQVCGRVSAPPAVLLCASRRRKRRMRVMMAAMASTNSAQVWA